MGYLFKTIRSGTVSLDRPAGVVEIKFLGAKVGVLENWTLQRRGDNDPEAGLYDLHAVFSFVSLPLWEDADYEKQITLNLNPVKQYRVQLEPDCRTVLTGRNLLIERVTIHNVTRS
jgi:hypothetical protein